MRKFSIVIVLFFAGILGLHANECIPNKQTPARLVNDFAELLSNSTINQLEKRLIVFNDTTSTQIAVVTVNSLCDYDASSFAFELGEKWGVGNEKFDNGIVILIKPKVGNSKGHAFIATGYGLEGVLPDAIAKRIVENEMISQFRQNNYEQGIINGVETIIEITGGEYSAQSYNKNGRQNSKPIPLFPFFLIVFFVIIMLSGTFKRARSYSSRNNTSLWLALMLMGSTRNRHKGYYDNFGRGRGGFGGFGGGSSGGFGGFGGGSFGGGGAGGSW